MVLMASVVLAAELAVFLFVKILPAFWIIGGLLGGIVGGLAVADLRTFFRAALGAWGVCVLAVVLAFVPSPDYLESLAWLIGPFAVLSLPFLLVFGVIGCLIRTGPDSPLP